jgi:hypothetical protein
MSEAESGVTSGMMLSGLLWSDAEAEVKSEESGMKSDAEFQPPELELDSDAEAELDSEAELDVGELRPGAVAWDLLFGMDDAVAVDPDLKQVDPDLARRQAVLSGWGMPIDTPVGRCKLNQ